MRLPRDIDLPAPWPAGITARPSAAALPMQIGAGSAPTLFAAPPPTVAVQR
jgi:hypothetical protein